MSDYYLEKPLPSNADAEKAIVGGIQLDNSLAAQALEVLTAADFYSPLYRMVADAEFKLFAESGKIDAITIAEKIKMSGGNADNIGGIAGIANLTYGLPTFRDLSEYIAIVAEKAKLRRVIKGCEAITSTILAENESTDTVLSFAQSTINDICADTEKQGFSKVSDLAVESLNEKIAIRKSNNYFTGLRTGLFAIDDATNGLQKSELIILAARPGIGKTSMLVNISEGVCEHQKDAVVAVFSLEMSKKKLTDRMLCSSAEVDATKYRNGSFDGEEYTRLKEAAIKLHEYKIEIDDTPALTPAQVRSKSMMLQAKHKRLDLIIVDYLQKMTASRRGDNTRLEIGSIARELKDMAKTLDVPVIAVSSLNRECESRNPPKPKMSDLSESNIIESEADVVAFLYREHYYRKEASPHHAEILFEKNRNGET